MKPRRELKPLSQFNDERRREIGPVEMPTGPVLNGLECPVCSMELMDTHPHVQLASNPPQKNVACQNCGFQGYRIA